MPWVPDADERSAILALIEEGTAPLREKLEKIEVVIERILGPPTDQTLDVIEAAKMLDVSERTVRRWIETNELKAVRAGHGWRITREVVQTRLGR